MWSHQTKNIVNQRPVRATGQRIPTKIDGSFSVGNDSDVLPPPFAHTEHRTVWLRATLLAASFLGLIASLPVWMNTRTFPLLPIFSGFPLLPAPWDKFLYGLMLISLPAAMWFYRPAVITFLIASFISYCGDQNRGQPWLYMYWVMLLLSLFRAPAATAACRIALAAVYVWSGLQKINLRFFEVTPNWFVAPATNWHLPPVAIELLKFSVKAAPFIEIAIGLLLWFPRTRRIAFALAILTHAFALLFLGPLGHNYNWVVWPWNLAMIALVLSLFATGRIFEPTKSAPTSGKLKPVAPKNTPQSTANGDAFGWTATRLELCRSRAALSIVALYTLLPILSYSGRWDSYFSFSLYSENVAVANIFVTESFRDNLPPKLQRHVEKFPQAYDPERQGPLLFVFPNWAIEELNVPTIFEPRNFVNIYRALQPYAKTPADLRMIIGPRSGPVIFREGERVEFLQRPQ